MDNILELKNYLVNIGYSKEKLDSYKDVKEKFLINLIINETKKKDKKFRESFFKTNNKKKLEWNNLIDTLNNNN